MAPAVLTWMEAWNAWAIDNLWLIFTVVTAVAVGCHIISWLAIRYVFQSLMKSDENDEKDDK